MFVYYTFSGLWEKKRFIQRSGGKRRFFAPEPQPSPQGEGSPLDKRKCGAVSRAQKNVAEKNGTKGVLAPSAHPTAVLRSPPNLRFDEPKAAKRLPTCYVQLVGFTNFI